LERGIKTRSISNISTTKESKVKMTEVMIILLALSAITFGIGVVFLITILRDLVKILEGKK